MKVLAVLACAVATGTLIALVLHKRQKVISKRAKCKFILQKYSKCSFVVALPPSTTKAVSQSRPVRVPIRKEVREPTSYANFHDCVIQHVSLDLFVDLSRKVLSGSVTLIVQVKKAGVVKLILDTNSIAVTSVTVNKISVPYSFGPPHEVFGSALAIELPEDCRSGDFNVDIQYETAPGEKCSALQWLPPEQTAGKDHPFVFTQCQAIHCRSLLPCQDAPCVKFTYDARIRVPVPLVALMSAMQTGIKTDDQSTVFSFKQDVPMSSYLVALAVGNLESRDIGPRSRVWSEPSVVDFAAYEFAETEKFLGAAEDICGEYVWGRYDLLMLPPSFPYGGMENPCLTFVTPTLLAGDRSLANVVAHEVAHSWSGNLVTNATWSDFWMNEGFTVFIERKIIERVYGIKAAGLKSALGWTHLQDAICHFGHLHEFTKLHIDMNDVDPDDSFSSVPYEKGCAFLTYLQDLVGGASQFEPFLKAHVLRFQYGTVSWDQWKLFFEQYFIEHDVSEEKLATIDWDAWIHSPGMPPVKPSVDTQLYDATVMAVESWLEKGSCKMEDNWNSDQKVVFLDQLIEKFTQPGFKMDASLLHKIDERYQFSKTKNSEIIFNWCTLCIRAHHEDVFELTVKFLVDQGRMKFVRPLFRDLFKCSENGKAVALGTFNKYKSQYHAIAQKMIARDLNV